MGKKEIINMLREIKIGFRDLVRRVNNQHLTNEAIMEQLVTDLEISGIESERAITDLEIAIIEGGN